MKFIPLCSSLGGLFKLWPFTILSNIGIRRLDSTLQAEAHFIASFSVTSAENPIKCFLLQVFLGFHLFFRNVSVLRAHCWSVTTGYNFSTEKWWRTAIGGCSSSDMPQNYKIKVCLSKKDWEKDKPLNGHVAVFPCAFQSQIWYYKFLPMLTTVHWDCSACSLTQKSVSRVWQNPSPEYFLSPEKHIPMQTDPRNRQI